MGHVIVSRLADLRRRVTAFGVRVMNEIWSTFHSHPEVPSHDVLRPLILLKRRSPEQFRAIENDMGRDLIRGCATKRTSRAALQCSRWLGICWTGEHAFAEFAV